MMYTGFRTNMYRGDLPTFAARKWSGEKRDLWSLAPPVMDQGPTGSCVGHARALGIYVSRAAQGVPLPFIPSPTDLYRVARCFERRDWSEPLEDLGCDPVDSIYGVRLWGFGPMQPLPERFSDAHPLTVNRPPTLLSFAMAVDHKSSDDFLVTDVGEDRALVVASALDAGFPVNIDVPGGSIAWQSYGGGLLSDRGARTDHYVTLLSHEVTAGGVVFRGRNSWGEGWGEKGDFLADASVVAAARVPIVCAYFPGDA